PLSPAQRRRAARGGLRRNREGPRAPQPPHAGPDFAGRNWNRGAGRSRFKRGRARRGAIGRGAGRARPRDGAPRGGRAPRGSARGCESKALKDLSGSRYGSNAVTTTIGAVSPEATRVKAPGLSAETRSKDSELPNVAGRSGVRSSRSDAGVMPEPEPGR